MKLHIKSKNNLLLLCIPVLLLICWQLALRPTYTAWTSYQTLKQSTEQNEQTDGAADGQGLQQKLAAQRSLLKCYQYDSSSWNSYLVSSIGQLTDEYNIDLEYRKSDMEAPPVLQQSISISGDYTDLVQVIASLEERYLIKNLRLHTVKNRPTVVIELRAIAAP